MFLNYSCIGITLRIVVEINFLILMLGSTLISTCRGLILGVKYYSKTIATRTSAETVSRGLVLSNWVVISQKKPDC